MRQYLIAAFALLALTAAAHGGPLTWDFSYSGAQGSGSGIIHTTDVAGSDGGFAALDIGGTRNGETILGLSWYAGADNELFADTRFVDFAGLSFYTASGDWNLFSNSDHYELWSHVDAVGYAQNGVPITFNSAGPVPEPPSLALFGAGVAMIGLTRRRRTQSPLPKQ
jgi:hypothetical protein